MAYTVARDEDSPYLVPLGEYTLGASVGQSVSQIARARRTFGDNSFLGLLVTDRRIEDGGAGTLGAIDGALQCFKNYRLESQIALSREVEPRLPEAIEDSVFFGRDDHSVALDGETFSGHAVYASLERSARVWSSDLDFWEYAPTFRSDNGFTSQNDYRQLNWWNGLAFQPNGEWVKEWDPRFGFGRNWFYDGTLKQEWIRPHASIDLKYQTNLFLEHWRGRERWNGHLYDGVNTTTIEVDSRFSELLGGSASLVVGREIWRSFDTDATLGRGLNASVSARIKPTANLVLSPSYSYARLRRPDDGSTLYDGYILRTRATYQFSRELTARCVVEYNEFDDGVSVEPLMTYRWNAFTVLYLGYGDHYQKYGVGTPYPDALTNEGTEWHRTTQQFFAKLQYLLRM